MAFRPHLTVTKHAEKIELLSAFITLSHDEFLGYIYPLLSETQWDRVKEEELQSIILYGHGGEGKTAVINEILGDIVKESDNLNLILQQEKGGLLQVFTYGRSDDNKCIFVRLGEKEVLELSKQIGGVIIVRFLPDPSC
jgi:Cdc6-like AAA superfamily ATPase